MEYYFVFSERRGTSLSIPEQSPHILLRAADYWEWTQQKLEPVLQQTMLLCKSIQSDSYNLYWDKWNLLFLLCWQWLCLHRQTVQRRSSRAAERNTWCRGLSSDMTCIFKDFTLSSLLHTSDWMIAGVRCTRQTHGIVCPLWAYLHLSPGQKRIFRLLPLTVLQFTLQMAMGYKEWMCIKLNIQSRRVSDKPQTPTALQDRTMRAIKEKMKSRQIRTELQQAVFLDEKLLLQIASTLMFEAMLCNTQERYSLWQTMSTRWTT